MNIKTVLTSIAMGILASQLPTGNVWIGIVEIILLGILSIDLYKYCNKK